MHDETVVPVFRTPKRRLVAPNKRKKASFSCDRCKLRKIACHRPSPSGPCTGCEKSKHECNTTIKRKKKIRGPIENIGLHYKCLHLLVKNLFPEIDVNNIDALIDFGERKGVVMPSRYGGNSEEEAKELKDLSLIITTGRMSASLGSLGDVRVKDESEEENTVAAPLNRELGIPHKDYIIIDLGGNSHCIGPLGAPSFMDLYLRIIAYKGDVDLLKWSTFQKIAKGELVISSSHEPIQQHDLSFLTSEKFPYSGEIGRQAADHYVDIFFSKIHHRFLCFNESIFRETHEKFWTALQTEIKDKLSNQAICCIYMVWILGRLYDPTDVAFKVEEPTIQKYLHIVKLCLSDILLTATLDGVRVLLLLSIYLDNRKRRETGYILVELAARQAVTLGLNRRSLSSCMEGKDKKEEMRRTWWTVFMMEVCFSIQMGRSSSIQIEDINMEYPTCLGVSGLPYYSQIFLGQMEMTKCLFKMLRYRRTLTRTSNILADDNVRKAFEVSQELNNIFGSFDSALLDLEVFDPSKLVLHLRYHYYSLLLTLPLFLHVASTPSVVMSDYISSLINQCGLLCIAIAGLIELSARHKVLNGTLFPDIFYAHLAVMGLVVFYLMLKDMNLGPKIKCTLPVIESAVNQIKNLHLSLSPLVAGTLQKLSKYIDAFVAGLEYLKCRPIQSLGDPDKEKEYRLVKAGNTGPNIGTDAQIKREATPTDMPDPNVARDDFLLFQGRLGIGELGIGSLDFGDLLMADFGFPTFDGNAGDGLFRFDGF